MKNPQKKSNFPKKSPSAKSRSVRANQAKKSNPPNLYRQKSSVLCADEMALDFGCVNYLTITANQDGQRIDNFLLGRLKGMPRSHVYKMIRDDEIRLNKKRIKPHARLSIGDVVRIAPVRISVPVAPIVSWELQQGLLSRIVYEDEGLLVLDKPSGMAVHGGSGESFGVIEAIRVALAKNYLELIHRIDKGTSGLIMIAKKRSVLKRLQEDLRQKNIKKTYLCLVLGHIAHSSQKITINQPLVKYTLASGECRVRVANANDNTAKDSITQIEVMAHLMVNGKKTTLVKAFPKTGRTHQIRVHMQSIGYPLIGDDKYNPAYRDNDKIRLCLHAYELIIPDYPPIKTPLPKDMAMLIENGGSDVHL